MIEGTLTFVVDSGSQRLDKFLVTCLPEFSRARLQALIADGKVSVNGTPARKSGQSLETGARIQIEIPPAAPTALIPEAIPLDIVFENTDLMIVNKPAGMVVHPAAGHSHGTLVHAALAHAPEMHGIGGEKRPGIVHRLDKDTSGLIVLAKNDTAHRWLQAQFKQRTVRKVYLALVDGHPPTPQGRVDAAIGRDPRERKRMAILSQGRGRRAISDYSTLQQWHKHTLLEIRLLTGRTHQIRLHTAFLGCPIVADTVYGHKKPTLPLKRQFLHAARLRITLPGEDKPRLFEAPLPEDLQAILNLLNNG